MPSSSRENSLSALRWLIEAGADEAIAETPINRFASVSPAASASPARLIPPTADAARLKSAETVSLSTAPGAARALATACTTLAELKAALLKFEGCELKRYAKNTVFADGRLRAASC